MKMQQPEALRLADKYEAHGFLGDHRFAKDQWCSQAAAELRRQHARIAELEDQMAAIGAGGVEPLRKTSADTSALRAALEEAEAALEVATSRLSARGANYPVHVTSEARALEIVRKALQETQPNHFRDATKMMATES